MYLLKKPVFMLDVCFSSSLLRYSIERVFRPKKLDRAHPRELLECAFDIITPVSNSLLPEAEIIYTISEIIQEFPVLQVTHKLLVLLLYFYVFNQTVGSDPRFLIIFLTDAVGDFFWSPLTSHSHS